VKRRKELEALQEGIASEINSELDGCVVEVLVEGRKKGKWWGRTRTDKLVFFTDPDDYLGRLVKIRIEGTSPWSLQGIVSSI
jgi:tRNA-2-methylthio-N6-dimethylallyladenosine synthase